MAAKQNRWPALIACAVAIFWPGAFIFGFPGILRKHWQQFFGAGDSSVGGTVFFMIAGATCFMYLCGRWQERFGPRRLAVWGSFVCGGSTIWLSWADSMVEVNIWAFILGASSAFIYLPGLTVVQRLYPDKRGLVAGFFNMAFGLSAAIMSPLFTVVLSNWGYQKLTLTAGAAAAVIGLTASTLLRFPQAVQFTSAADMHAVPSDRSVGEALKSKAFWCLWLTWVFAGAAGASMLVLATGFGLAQGLSLPQAVVLLTAFNLTNGCGRLISGILSDRIGRSQTMALSFGCAGLSYLAMPHMADQIVWAILAAVIGFAFGTMFAVSGPLAGDCFGMAHFGAIFGLIFTAYGFVAGPLGPWLSGHILDVTGGNYRLVFSFLGLLYFCASGLILTVKPWRECRL